LDESAGGGEIPDSDLNDVFVFSELPSQSQRTETQVYSRNKSVGSKAIKLPVNPPFNLTIEALTRTKIHFSSVTRSLSNEVIEAGVTREFNFSGTLRFDLWSA